MSQTRLKDAEMQQEKKNVAHSHEMKVAKNICRIKICLLWVGFAAIIVISSSSAWLLYEYFSFALATKENLVAFVEAHSSKVISAAFGAVPPTILWIKKGT